MWAQLGIDEDLQLCQVEDTQWGGLQPYTRVQKGDPIFPRIELDDVTDVEKPAVAAAEGPKAGGKTMDQTEAGKPLVSIDDFAKLELRVAEIKKAEPVPGADRLLQLQITIGSEERQIVAGIAQHYQPEDLIGKHIVVVANLKPAKVRGVVSQGMLLAASTTDSLGLITVEKDIPSGAQVK